MIEARRGERAIRAVALVAVLVLAALSLSSVVAAGWQHGTDAVGGLENDPERTIERGGEPSAGTWAETGPAKRDGAVNDTDEPKRTTDPEETRSVTKHTSETGTTDDVSTATAARATEWGNRTRSETTRSESTRASEGKVMENATVGEASGTTADDPDADTPGTVGDRDGGTDRTHSTLRSGLWIVGGLGVLTTLFSLGGFVAAVLAYRGTD